MQSLTTKLDAATDALQRGNTNAAAMILSAGEGSREDRVQLTLL